MTFYCDRNGEPWEGSEQSLSFGLSFGHLVFVIWSLVYKDQICHLVFIVFFWLLSGKPRVGLGRPDGVTAIPIERTGNCYKKIDLGKCWRCSVMLVRGEVPRSSVKPSLRKGHFNKDFR